MFARHRVTLTIRLNFVFSKFGASPFYIAVFVSGNAASTESYFTPLARNIMSVRYVSFAYAAVHAQGAISSGVNSFSAINGY